VKLLSTLPVNQLKRLAHSDVLSFAPRFPASHWAAFLLKEPVCHQPEENAIRQLRLMLAKPSLKPS
ncbi:MAG: transcriptional regulator, partial [Methylococcales bacterium]